MESDKTLEFKGKERGALQQKVSGFKKIPFGSLSLAAVFGGASVLTYNNLFGQTAPVSDLEPQTEIDQCVDVALEISDQMSFDQAFAAARDEIGSGGVFMWRGQLYNTFTAEEWNGMSDAEKLEFNQCVQNTSSEIHEMVAGYNLQQDQAAPENPMLDPLETAPVSCSVEDDMSFGDAFETARNELGPGGVFVWRGQAYNTYLSEEWNQMTEEQKLDFSESVQNADTEIQMAIQNWNAQDPEAPEPPASVEDIVTNDFDWNDGFALS